MRLLTQAAVATVFTFGLAAKQPRTVNSISHNRITCANARHHPPPSCAALTNLDFDHYQRTSSAWSSFAYSDVVTSTTFIIPGLVESSCFTTHKTLGA